MKVPLFVISEISSQISLFGVPLFVVFTVLYKIPSPIEDSLGQNVYITFGLSAFLLLFVLPKLIDAYLSGKIYETHFPDLRFLNAEKCPKNLIYNLTYTCNSVLSHGWNSTKCRSVIKFLSKIPILVPEPIYTFMKATTH